MRFAILSTFIKLPFVFKIFVLSIFEWPFYTGFSVKADMKKVSILPKMHMSRLTVSWEIGKLDLDK